MTDARRLPGPPPPVAVRSSGEAPFAQLAEEAVAASGRVERATHGFHTYPAGMHADCAAALIAGLPVPDGATGVHDPFCGGGTVLVEAVLHERPTSGADLSPVARLVARARTAGPTRATPLRSHARKLAERGRSSVPTHVPDICRDWYEPHVAFELGRIRDGIEAVSDAGTQGLLSAVLSSIVVKASWRESDTSNRRRPHQRPLGTTSVLFHKKARELGRMLETMPAEASVKIRAGDARRLSPPPGTGLVLTSPPYPGVYDYLPMQQLRHAWLSVDPGAGFAAEVGSRRSFRSQGRREALRQWRHDTDDWMRTQADALPSGGWLCVVVGDGLVAGRPVDTLSPTIEAARAAGLTIAARASADRPDHARDTVRTEHLVLARRP